MWRLETFFYAAWQTHTSHFHFPQACVERVRGGTRHGARTRPFLMPLSFKYFTCTSTLPLGGTPAKRAMEGGGEKHKNNLGHGTLGAVFSATLADRSASNDAAAASGSSSVEVDEGPPFVNHRLAAWERQREEWVAAGKAGAAAKEAAAGGSLNGRQGAHRRPVLSADATYDDLLTSSRPFPKPVPLAEMVDFLVEVWDEDGLYD